ncbi:MAG: nucleotide sugar dehydrogenase [Bacteroidota bacterium]
MPSSSLPVAEEPTVPLSPPALALSERLQAGTARIGVIGLGYVGLPLAFEFAQQGFATLGIDLDAQRVRQLQQGHNFIQDLDDDAVRAVVEAGHLRAADHFDQASSLDVLFLCVPTPVHASKDPDVSFIRTATEAVAPHLRAGQLIVLKSTTYPGTTEDLVQPILELAAQAQSLELGRDYFLAFSPERIDPGNQTFTTANTPVVVGGVTDACTHLAAQALGRIVAHVHPVSSPKVAEMEKLLENIFRSVNIALVNELARLCDRIGGISVWEVVEAAATKPFGYMPFWPGPGLGGHCIPIDPYYLSWVARRYDFETSFITLAARVNEEMPYYVVEAVTRAVAEQPVRLREAPVLLLGVAFKKNVDDTRHAPALKILELLHERGYRHVQYHDPHVPELEVARDGHPVRLTSQPLTAELVAEQAVVVIVTDHAAVDYEMVAREAGCVIDTRNALAEVPHDPDRVLLIGGGTLLQHPGPS